MKTLSVQCNWVHKSMVKKILMICEFYNEELEYQENLLTKYYRKNRYDVTVITSTFDSVFDYYNDNYDKTKPARTYYDNGAKIIKLPYRYNILNRFRGHEKLDAIIAEEKPDLIYVHDISPNFPEFISYVKNNSNCRMIMDYHADYSNSGKNWISLKILHGVMRKYLLDMARPYLSRIFPIIPASRDFLHEVYGVPHGEMEILPLGADIDLAREVRRNCEGRKLRKHYGIPEDEMVIFTGGKLTALKRTELVIEAVNRLGRKSLHLIIVGEAGKGDEAYRHSLETTAASNPNIRFAGWLDKGAIYRHLDMADLAVFPASQSILWLQAIGAGLPLIAGNTGHQSVEYVNQHDNIIILEKDHISTDGITAAIASVIDNPARMRQMGEGAERVADEQLNWDRLIERTLVGQ